jgi:epoxyqueuosine reductase
MESIEKNLSVLIKKKALSLGFDICGIAKVRTLADNGAVLKKWCEAGMNGKIRYLENNIEKRINPEILFPGAKSLIVTGISYYSEIKQKKNGVPVISRYAYGTDYHYVITRKLEELLLFIKDTDPSARGRSFVDSSSILEKAWAKEAGLGWQGKHSIVINRKIGSFFFIGILILNKEIEYDQPFESEYCGDCRLCIDLCPTGAINNDRTIDVRKCIANLTIEDRGPIPDEIIPKLGGRVYGCDRCQEVCPWNNKAIPDAHPEFRLADEIAEMGSDDWQSLTRERFDRLFNNSAMNRVKYDHFMENVRIVTKSRN